MILQHSSELAIRATLFLAQQAPGKLTPVHEIAADFGAPVAYLAKVLQRLASAGLVRSFRGPGKGMELGRAPEAITLSAVVLAAQGPTDSDRCVLGLSMCSDENPCALHHDWVPLRTALNDLLEKTTLADLVRSVRERPGRPAAQLSEMLPIPARERQSPDWRSPETGTAQGPGSPADFGDDDKERRQQ